MNHCLKKSFSNVTDCLMKAMKTFLTLVFANLEGNGEKHNPKIDLKILITLF